MKGMRLKTSYIDTKSGKESQNRAESDPQLLEEGMIFEIATTLFEVMKIEKI